MTDKNKVMQLQGQTWRVVKDLKDFLGSIKLSSEKRVFAKNGVNSHSSRSHHVFQIKFFSTDKLRKPR